jgi:hypothetical protein
MHKIILALQFWEGDKATAMRIARMMADIEPAFRDDVLFLFCARFDCVHDKETVEYVSKKFPVETYTCFRRCTGWPAGPNAIWHDVTNELAARRMRGGLQEYEAVFTFEPDVVPIRKDWIDQLHLEWKNTHEQGKSLTGCWLPFCGNGLGHINGNMLLAIDLVLRLRMVGSDPTTGWDDTWAPVLEPHWVKAGWIKNLYRAVNVSDEDIKAEWIPGVKPSLIHGVKDDSVEKYARRKFFSDTQTGV